MSVSIACRFPPIGCFHPLPCIHDLPKGAIKGGNNKSNIRKCAVKAWLKTKYFVQDTQGKTIRFEHRLLNFQFAKSVAVMPVFGFKFLCIELFV